MQSTLSGKVCRFIKLFINRLSYWVSRLLFFFLSDDLLIMQKMIRNTFFRYRSAHEYCMICLTSIWIALPVTCSYTRFIRLIDRAFLCVYSFILNRIPKPAKYATASSINDGSEWDYIIADNVERKMCKRRQRLFGNLHGNRLTWYRSMIFLLCCGKYYHLLTNMNKPRNDIVILGCNNEFRDYVLYVICMYEYYECIS